MEVIKTIEKVRELVKQAKRDGKSVGFVPTMGALHAGHVSLIDEAVKQTDFVVVSVFVNPTQFGAGEDIDKYPRTLEADVEKCELAGGAVVFAPSAGEMYPEEIISWVDVEGLTEGLCGGSRAGHFRGVVTVCAKLFNIVGADKAFFGQKDAQQVVVIKKMVRDLNIPVEIIVCPIVREQDGLAMSSRNKYLNPAEREQAVLLSRSLERCSELFKGGEKRVSMLKDEMRKILGEGKDIEPEYIEMVDSENLEAVEEAKQGVLVAIAARVGGTRLIDNIILA